MNIPVVQYPRLADIVFETNSDTDGQHQDSEVPMGAIHFFNGEHNCTNLMAYRCPCGCGIAAMPVVRASDVPRNPQDGWAWNGDEVKPTLSPSVQKLGPCRWHGHLVNGEWVKC